ncbi:HRDC domain-containing protein [Paenibacillus hamazuiensis]|uniref:HRDC domain-containing protein n=1 Tax=Paenibacillus hamazuiensis TaxID=2936508 RepID=UPI00201087D3|nr:HRDC domain-containing protein [Paenibacillus hamazuiensis]
MDNFKTNGTRKHLSYTVGEVLFCVLRLEADHHSKEETDVNVVFLTTLEKKTTENRVKTARLTIAEQQGEWNAIWSEPRDDGKMQQSVWYEGHSWESLMEAFRQNLYVKQSEGYRPLLDAAVADPVELMGERYAQAMMLQYYSEFSSNEELYEQLRQWRREQSAKDGKSPFILATNKTLRMISAFVPHTTEELMQLPGVGEQRAKQYGEAILRLTQPYDREMAFPLNWVENRVNRAEFVLWLQQQKEEKRKAEQQRKELKLSLLEAVSQGAALATLADKTSLKRRDLVAWAEELDREGYDMTPLADAELKSVPAAEVEKALGAFDLLGDRYLKPVLESMYKPDELKGKEIDRIYEWLRLLRLKYRKTKSPDIVEAS